MCNGRAVTSRTGSKHLASVVTPHASCLGGTAHPTACLPPLQGEGGDHLQLRQRVMGYVEEREEEYKFFM